MLFLHKLMREKYSMKEFVKYTLATMAGLVLAGILFFVVGIIALAGLMTFDKAAPVVRSNSVLHIALDGALMEDVKDNPLGELLGEKYQELSLKSLLKAIHSAQTDDRITGIYLEAGNLQGASPAMVEELRGALSDFKESGKFILSYGNSYSQSCYYLASVSDKVLLNPEGSVMWAGMAAQPVFYKNLLEKLGVKMQVFRVGTYKSAVEPFIADKMSEANRQQVSSYMNDIWDKILKDVSNSRKISTENLDQYADTLLYFSPAEVLVRRKIVDALCYMDGVETCLKEMNGGELNLVDVEDWIAAQVPANNKPADQVAIYYAYGDIVDQSDDWADNVIDASVVCRDLKKLREDDHVKAVVLRINSGGGSAFASEQIWHELMLMKQQKPVVVSMGGMAASGAYYLSSAAHYIYAQPMTLTGSIGIFGLVPDGSGLLTDKLGLDFDVVKTNRHSDFGSISRPFNAEESVLMQKQIEDGYQLFVKRVADGRKMSRIRVDSLAQGRVWTGHQALAMNLVDANGSLDDAIDKAVQMSGVTDYRTVAYPEPEQWYQVLLKDTRSHYLDSQIRSALGDQYVIYDHFNRLIRMGGIQARVPYMLNLINWN